MLNIFSFRGHPIEYSKKEFEKYDYFLMAHFTTSIFLRNIQKNGVSPPRITNNFSNDDMYKNGDENYIYLAATWNALIANNAVEKYGGDPIIIFTKVDKNKLEVDNLLNFLGKGINPRDENLLYKQLTSGCAQCRTKYIIEPDALISAYKTSEINKCLKNDYETITYNDFMNLYMDKLVNLL